MLAPQARPLISNHDVNCIKPLGKIYAESNVAREANQDVPVSVPSNPLALSTRLAASSAMIGFGQT